MPPPSPPLPIDSVLDTVCATLAERGVLVLQAEPGAGKTTRVPAALLDRGLAGDGAVVVLEPRRVAARAAADFVAAERGEALGTAVGYQVRFERCGDAATRLWFVTDGVALRRLSTDPFLEGVGALVLDEFHERHLAVDAVLAAADELRRSLRPDLKLLVMSATLDTAAIARHLDDCPVIRCPGTTYPVTVEYRPPRAGEPLAQSVTAAVRSLHADDGDILVFLPGVGEIRRTGEELAAAGIDRERRVLVLHGDLPLEEQRRVLRRGSERRIVLATNVAESSVTVDGVRAVIDSGLARIADFDTARGIDRLRRRPIARAAAEQRAGRAGRQGPGRCIRLWSKHDHSGRRDGELPEVRRLDLAGTLLELHAWGLREPAALRWFDPPPAAALAAAEKLLRDLGAVDGQPAARLTPIGKRMLRLPAPPRAARLLVEAVRRGQARAGALYAALLSERDVWSGARPAVRDGRDSPARARRPAGQSDLAWRAELFAAAEAAAFSAAACRRLEVDPGAARAVARAQRQLLNAVGGAASEESRDDDALLRATFVAYADRLARRRGAGSERAVMASGGGMRLDEQSCVRDAELFVALDARAGAARQHAEATVTMASAVAADWLREYFASDLSEVESLEFDEAGQRVVAVRRERFRDLVLREDRQPTRGGAGSAVLLQRVLADPQRLLDLSPRAEALLRRIEFAGSRDGATSLAAGDLLHRLAAAACAGADTMAAVRRADGAALVAGLLSYDERRRLDRAAPETFTLPSGRQAAIDYGRASGPVVAARIQELFGLRANPRIGAAGDVVVAIELLGPNQRPVQLTSDIAGFWSNTYPAVRRELRGRYPKHDWPEDPTTATPTSRARSRAAPPTRIQRPRR